MSLLSLLIFGIFALLSVLWFFLIRRDVRAYVLSQVKVLGEQHRAYVDTKKLRLFLTFYAVTLGVVFSAFFFFFLSFS